MKLTCTQENFSHGLAIVNRAVANKSTLPITQNVLMTTDKSRLKLSATNLEIGITTWIGGDVDDEGAKPSGEESKAADVDEVRTTL